MEGLRAWLKRVASDPDAQVLGVVALFFVLLWSMFAIMERQGWKGETALGVMLLVVAVGVIVLFLAVPAVYRFFRDGPRPPGERKRGTHKRGRWTT